jgi:GT2 family glycosyltransferase
MMPANAPSISIIIPAYHSQQTIATSLRSLLGQYFPSFEIIVVDSSPDDRCENIVRSKFPRVRYIRSHDRLLPHAARNLGAAHAEGAILAFTDPDCVAERDWLGRLVRHHQKGRVVIGGAIRSTTGWWNHAVHATKYQWWDPDSAAGRRSEIPSGNFSIARNVWDQVGGFRGEYFAGDSELCWRIRSNGYDIWFDPLAVVTHLPHERFPRFLHERIQRGRDFGRMRVQVERWRPGQCLLYLAAAPALPLVMTARSAMYAAKGRFMLRWCSTAPVQILGNSLWCCGEAAAHWNRLWQH